MQSITRGISLSGAQIAAVLAIAGVIGFALGTWLGNVTRPTSVEAAVKASPSVVVTPFPSAAPSATPTEAPAPSQTAPRPQGVILSLQGDAYDVSDSFEVKPGWQIQWQIDGSSIAIAVTGDTNLGVLVQESGPASGVTGIAQGGVFRLDIAASGPWSVTVIDGEDPAPSG